MEFSRDINGLRAIAVAAVVLFHFAVPGFDGGFVGVDVFFVISGYLMTKIIVTRMEQDRLSIIAFYGDRVRRIVPALLVLCLALLMLGRFALLPSEYKRLGKQVEGSLAFISNFFFWREAGYFDVASHRKWLLHTWSLSVEWQFYLLYPLMLVGLKRLAGLASLRWAVLATTLASLAWSVHHSVQAPNASFYLLPTRSWELLLGGLVFLFPLRSGAVSRRLLEVAGVMLVAFSVWAFDSKHAWPGAFALGPTLGTAAVIWAARNQMALLGNVGMQWLGRGSYSIYLWHWPVVVAMNEWAQLPIPWRAASGMLVAIALGGASYLWVEIPTRSRGVATGGVGGPTTFRRATLAGGTLAAMVFAAGTWATDGVPTRFSQAVRVADLEALNGNPFGRACFATSGSPKPACIVGRQDHPPAVEMIGDSHALSVVTALAAATGEMRGAGVTFHGYAACPTATGATYGVTENECGVFNRQTHVELSRAGQSAPPLVITNSWTAYIEQRRIRFEQSATSSTDLLPFTPALYRERLLDTLCTAARQRHVFVTLPFPAFDAEVPRAVARRIMRDAKAEDLTMDLQTHLRRNAFILDVLKEAHTRCSVGLLDPIPYLCPGGRCMGSLAGRPLYSDAHHLSEYGNRLLIPMFKHLFLEPPVQH